MEIAVDKYDSKVRLADPGKCSLGTPTDTS